ncbi:MAG: hypothetical protein CMP85_08075 [Gammaproteobacteria bacterium]|nr:hypothetical protein [Gammaproteobacteria bacterium]
MPRNRTQVQNRGNDQSMIRCEYFDKADSKNETDLNQTVGQIVLQPNHSLSWRALKYFLAFMMLVSFGIAITFVFFGYWLVLPFTGLEMAFLSYCLWRCLRRTSLQEVIVFSADEIRLETGIDGPDRTRSLGVFLHEDPHQPGHSPLVP